MKKCASCSKDLPDAALHCVFCGAKQPPAPATSGGLAKTVMGSYSASDMMEHLKGQQPGGPGRPAGPSYGAPSQPSPYRPPAPAPAPAPAPGPPMGHGPARGPGPGGPAPFSPHGVPPAPSAAPTMFVPGGAPSPPQGGGFGGGPPARPMPQPQPFNPPAGAFHAGPGPGMGPGPGFGPGPGMGPGPGFGPGPGGPGGPGGPMPMAYAAPNMQPPGPMPMPMGQPGMPPHLAAHAARGNRPLEPWKDSLRLMMFLWGGALLLVFVVPLSIDPLRFHWNDIIDFEGKAKLPPLVMAAVGLLSIVLALIPTSPAPRGLIAGVLGLVGVALPLVLNEVTEWKALVPVAGLLLLIPGLLIREEYRESILPRIMVTLGVIAVLLPFLLPENGKLPLVELFKLAIDVPGKAKIFPLLTIAYIVLVVLTLLAWLPAPASGGAKVFAWLLLLWPALVLLTGLVLNDQIVDAITKTPNQVILWARDTSYAVLVGYGFATVIGKKLE